MSDQAQATQVVPATEEEEVPFAGDEQPVTGAALAAAAVDGGFDASLLTGVGTIGDVIPAGSKARFRVKSFKEGESSPWVPREGADAKALASAARRSHWAKFGPQPYFSLQVVCTQEPWTGKHIFPFVQFVNQKTQDAARSGDAAAVEIIKARCVALNSLMKGAEYQPTGRFDVKAFLGANPEFGASVSVGKNFKGQPANDIAEYIPISKLR